MNKTYIFNLTPMGKPRMTRADAWKKRDVVLRYFAFCDELRLLAKRQRFIPDESSMKICFYLPMPDSWSKKKKIENLGAPHQQKPDVDNLLKSFLDGLLEDDSKVWCLSGLSKRWNDKGQIVITQQE